ncbi:hypothetical protein E4U37_003115 [Claviceps purpurea]|nr:hypothetical protein E4U37_003115 [Claviceps purpurea]
MPLGPSLTLSNLTVSAFVQTHQIPAKPDHSSGISAVSRHAGAETSGLGELLKTKQLRKMVDSYNGGNKSFEAITSPELDFTPQSSLAELGKTALPFTHGPQRIRRRRRFSSETCPSGTRLMALRAKVRAPRMSGCSMASLSCWSTPTMATVPTSRHTKLTGVFFFFGLPSTF